MPPSTSPERSPGSALEPPRFSLRALLLWMTALGCLFGLMAAVGRTWAVVLFFFVVLAMAHVLGNSLGTKLRDRASRRERPIDETPPEPARPLLELAPPGRLTQHVRLSRITPIVTVGAALVGGTLGGTQFFAMYPDSGPWAVLLGVVSSAVLGGFAGFVTTSFISVARQAMREALAECDYPPHGSVSRRPR